MKSNSKELHKAITTLLKTRVSTVSYLNIPKPISYPYAVFNLRLVGTSYGQQQYQLEIDVVTRDIASVEELADNIQDDLDYYVFKDTNVFFHAYRSSRYPVVEEDKGIERRHLTFELYFYTRS